jgi:signal peptidase I
MAISAKIPRIASIIAFLLAGGVIIGALMGPIIILPFALIPLMAGIGIMRRRVWSAYGFGLYFFAQLLVGMLNQFRPDGLATLPRGMLGLAAWTIILGSLFLLAGRSLAISGAEPGRKFAWIAFSASITVSFFFVRPYVIPTGTMEDTLLMGDRILVQRFPKPVLARGDIVVFAYPIDRRQTFVRRIIGAPGDRIRISAKVVYRNGGAIKEPYAVHKTDYEDRYRDNFPAEPSTRIYPAAREMLEGVVNGEVIVPGGRYFVLGDNRDMSLDSRYWGFVSAGDVIGRPLLIYDSAEQPTEDLMKGERFTLRRVRWGRLFKLL